MEKDNRKHRFCFIDYMWYVALFHLFSWMVAFAVVMILCFLPGLFCKLRYTAGRREALRERYREMKHPGRILCQIVLAAIALTVANFALMFHFGFIHWA